VDPLYRQMNSPWRHNQGTRGNCAYEHTPRVTRVNYAWWQVTKETIEGQVSAQAKESETASSEGGVRLWSVHIHVA